MICPPPMSVSIRSDSSKVMIRSPPPGELKSELLMSGSMLVASQLSAAASFCGTVQLGIAAGQLCALSTKPTFWVTWCPCVLDLSWTRFLVRLALRDHNPRYYWAAFNSAPALKATGQSEYNTPIGSGLEFGNASTCLRERHDEEVQIRTQRSLGLSLAVLSDTRTRASPRHIGFPQGLCRSRSVFRR